MIAPQEIPGSPRFVVLLFVGHISGRRGKTGPSPMRMRAEPLILRVFSTTGGRGDRRYLFAVVRSCPIIKQKNAVNFPRAVFTRLRPSGYIRISDMDRD
jgi:hypothetical protein